MKSIAFIIGALAVALLTGCQSILLDRREYHGAAVTDTFMREPVRRTFELPPRRPPSTVRGRDKLVGKWLCHKVSNSKTACYINSARYGETHRMESDMEYSFFEDGALELRTRYTPNTGWSTQSGTWKYSGNKLTCWLGTYQTDMRVIWYGDDEFFLKELDLGQMARAASTNGIECRMWYDNDNCLHTDFENYCGGRMTMIESPQVYNRVGGAR